MWGSKMILCSDRGIFKARLCAFRNFLEKGKSNNAEEKLVQLQEQNPSGRKD